MVKRIKELPSLLITQIAAGEIIERPASIVKELIENAIDANADKISIRIEEGGKKKIVVIDNGDGIHSDDLIMASKRHSTSKISDMQDLVSISTLGFRGEALASMTAVSRLTIESSNGEEQGIGRKVVLTEEKVLIPPTLVGRPRGTTIMVEGLFYNIPARKKFLKTNRMETSYIVEVVSRYALLYPHIAFSLEQSGKEYIRTQGNGILDHVIAHIYGTKELQYFKPISYINGNIEITGAITSGDGAKKTRKNQIVGLNGRWIKNPSIYQKIEDGTRVYIPPGLFAQVVMNIKINPNGIDCNAHPTKAEVRIMDEDQLLNYIEESVKEALASEREDHSPVEDLDFPKIEMLGALEEAVEINIIGQLKDTYILCEINNKLMIIDQHAAHEAIIYHYLKESVLKNRGTMSKVELTKPVIISVTPQQEVLFEKHKEDLSKMGFEVELFGHRSLIVREIPNGVDPEQIEGHIQEILSDGITMYNDWLKNTLISTSCKSAIKANQPLDEHTMLYLIKELVLNQITNCPHGRPLYMTTAIQDIHKKFKRIL